MFSIKRYLPRIKAYLKDNHGASFVIGFQILLLVCAGLLILGNSVLANELAVIAYFSLVIGVVLQLVSSLRHGERDQEK
jgi:hypothetical protein